MKLAKFVHWQIHVETVHRCKKFCKYFAYITRHRCINVPHVLGAGRNADVNLIEDKLKTNKIQLISRGHGNSLIVLHAKISHMIDSFSEAMEFIYVDIERIIKYLFSVYSAIKMAISFQTFLEKSESGEIKPRTYFSPSMIYSDPNIIYTRL
jgi:hypothetical protein